MLTLEERHILALKPNDFQLLIGKLCAAELARQCISTAHSHYGGHLLAPDGGIDVLFDPKELFNANNTYIPSGFVGFQAKGFDFSIRKIKSELLPKKKPRELVKELIHNGGVYVLVSNSNSSTPVRKERERELNKIIQEKYSGQTWQSSYMDTHELSKWANNFPSICLWVRDQINEPIFGWKGFGKWSTPFFDEDTLYLDDNPRIIPLQETFHGKLNIHDGVNFIRKTINHERKARIVGLSGTGKTRLVEALFDNTLGSNSLNSAEAIYSNLEHNPYPAPIHMLERLLSSEYYSVLIIDNCPLELHQKLDQILKNSSSKYVKLITVELDIREVDNLEGTGFLLEKSSELVLENALKSIIPLAPYPLVKRILELSDGNFRVAFILAKGTRSFNKVLPQLSDKTFVEKLLFGRDNTSNHDTKRIAEIIGGFYSFSIDKSEKYEDESIILADLFDIKVYQLKRAIQDLERLGIVQQRNIWRAFLPTGLANHFALRLFSYHSPKILYQKLTDLGQVRLRKSLLRRMHELSTEGEWKDFSLFWWGINKEEFLSITDKYSSLVDEFRLLAPLSQLATLEIIEEILLAKSKIEHTLYRELYQVCISIAYEDAFFIRACTLLFKLECLGAHNELYTNGRGNLQSLFKLKLSNTHASVATRLTYVEYLLNSKESKAYETAIVLLDQLLKMNSFTGSVSENFGGRIKDYGFLPNKKEDYINWFVSILNYIISNYSLKPKMILDFQKIVGYNIYEYWGDNTVESTFYQFYALLQIESLFWYWGWYGVKRALNYREKSYYNPKSYQKLKKLEIELRPKNIEIEITVFIAQKYGVVFDLLNSPIKQKNRKEKINSKLFFEEIGSRCYSSKINLDPVLDEIIRGENPTAAYHFGQGFAKADIRSELWQTIFKIYNESREPLNSGLLHGYYDGMKCVNPNYASKASINILNSIPIQKMNSHLVLDIAFAENKISYISDLIENNQVPAKTFQELGAWLAKHEGIAVSAVIDLFRKLSVKESGVEVALVTMIKYSTFKPNERIEELNELFIELLLTLDLRTIQPASVITELDISEIIFVLGSNNFKSNRIKEFLDKICDHMSANYLSGYDFAYYFKEMSKSYPYIMLEKFFSEGFTLPIDSVPGVKNDVFNNLSIGVHDIIQWIEENPDVRIQKLENIIPWFEESGSESRISTFGHALFKSKINTPLLLTSLLNAISRVEIYRLVGKLKILDKRRSLLGEIKSIVNPNFHSVIIESEIRFNELYLKIKTSEEGEAKLMTQWESFE